MCVYIRIRYAPRVFSGKERKSYLSSMLRTHGFVNENLVGWLEDGTRRQPTTDNRTDLIQQPTTSNQQPSTIKSSLLTSHLSIHTITYHQYSKRNPFILMYRTIRTISKRLQYTSLESPFLPFVTNRIDT